MRLASLFLVEFVAFLLILGETYFFFAVVVPLGAVPRSPLDYTGYALLKLGLTFGLGVLWFVLVDASARLYVRSMVRRRIPTASS